MNKLRIPIVVDHVCNVRNSSRVYRKLGGP